MTEILKGVRILEVAEHTFVPAASAALADLGADVIKIEHVERGDAMRGLAATGVFSLDGDIHPLLEHSNRGKRSLALDLTSDEGLEVLAKLAKISDVFLTNKLPGVRKKLRIDFDQIREANPDIIYVRGTGQGDRGPDADAGSYDALAFWARAGIGLGCMPPDYDSTIGPPGPGFGDSLGGMTIAGAIMGALFHRLNTGETTTVDVSLLSTGMWAMGQAVAISEHTGKPWEMPTQSNMPMRNPLVGNYRTADDRWVSLCCLQAGRYWAQICELLGRPEWATDERFADHVSLLTNHAEATAWLTETFLSAPIQTWREKLQPFRGQWCAVQNTVEAAADPQSQANGYIQETQSASGVPFRLVSVPMQYNGEPTPVKRAPEFNEHGNEILEQIGLDTDAIIDLKVKGIVA